MEALALFKNNVDSLFDLCFLPQPTACLSLFRSCLSLSCTNQVDYVAAICCSSFFFFFISPRLIFLFFQATPFDQSKTETQTKSHTCSLSHYCSTTDERAEGNNVHLRPTIANARQTLSNFDATALSSSKDLLSVWMHKIVSSRKSSGTFLLHVIPSPYYFQRAFSARSVRLARQPILGVEADDLPGN